MTAVNDTGASAAPIRIAFATDKDYVHHTATALRSILAHNRGPIEATVLYSDLDAGQLEDLRASCPAPDIAFHFVAIDPGRLSDLPLLRNHRSHASYFRLLLPDVMPQEADKVLYLDSDIVCRGDLRPLWETDISLVAAACVREPLMRAQSKRSLWRKLLPSREQTAGLHRAEYFNSGVLLINLARWRENKVTQRALSWRRDNAHRTALHDQDALNAVLEGNWLQLSARWNFGPWFPRMTHYCFAANRERLNPVLVHLSSGTGPGVYRRLARRHFAATAWGRAGLHRTRKSLPARIREHASFELAILRGMCLAFRYGPATEFGRPAPARLPTPVAAD